MWPRVRRISEDRRTASEKSEVNEVRAARKRLPKLWPSKPEPFSNLCRKSLDSKASSSLRATMQLRMSPGGNILNSFRSRPLDPPSSLTVTTAQRSRIEGEPALAGVDSAGEGTNFLSPLSKVDRPVPPPIATTRRPPVCAVLSCVEYSAALISILLVLGVELEGFFLAELTRSLKFGSWIGIQQLGKAGILGEILEVGVVACLETQLWVQPKGFVQMAQRIFHMTRQTIQRGQPVCDVVRFGVLLEQLIEMLAGGDVITNVHERDCVVEVLFRRFELGCRGSIEMLTANAEMNGCAVGQLLAGSGKHLLE